MTDSKWLCGTASAALRPVHRPRVDTLNQPSCEGIGGCSPEAIRVELEWLDELHGERDFNDWRVQERGEADRSCRRHGRAVVAIRLPQCRRHGRAPMP